MSPHVNTVFVQENFTINLPEDHRDGYTWNCCEGSDHQVIEMVNSAWRGNEKGVDFNFAAMSAGQTTLTFVKRKHIDTSETRNYIIQVLTK